MSNLCLVAPTRLQRGTWCSIAPCRAAAHGPSGNSESAQICAVLPQRSCADTASKMAYLASPSISPAIVAINDSLRASPERLWIRRFLVRSQEGQLQAPQPLTSGCGGCVLCSLRGCSSFRPAQTITRQEPDVGSAVALETSGKSAGRRIERTERSTSSRGQ